jgi:hypothetical protein
MTNELTPQEKYPKFYESPHLWIGAIEVEYIGTKNGIVGKSLLDIELLSTLITIDQLQNCKPLFKPQEGEQFIKDLESAVSAATRRKNVKHCSYDAVSELFNVNEGEFFVEVFDKTFAICVPYKAYFDAATFIDTLRKLGYYL